ncbi:MAG TPA: glycosyltransferase, partial [Gammaproteobacteria bacterium]|nr:glycosyltransferase [Gammaproteobacteria bacterium]
ILLLVGSALALLAWLAVLSAPHQPHRARERLEADPAAADDLSSVNVLIPARDEAAVIGRTVAALHAQGRRLEVVVIDDQSSDDTRGAATRVARPDLPLRVLAGRPLPEGWAGKLWALEQGLAVVERPYVLLLDADIELAPHTVPALLAAALERDATLVSLLAELHCTTLWEKLLSPAFVLFFKLLYPFAWSNDARKATAAAAGGCMLVRTDVLREIGGFAAIRGALIDDCTLAAALKHSRPPIWLGMTHSVRSLRVYATLDDFWRMVSRSAFTQLRYSTAWLLAATLLMGVTLLVPVAGVAAGIVAGDRWLLASAAAAWLATGAVYWPVVAFYRLSPAWAATLPVAAVLFLAMTWSSAIGYWRGTRASWKARDYARPS